MATIVIYCPSQYTALAIIELLRISTQVFEEVLNTVDKINETLSKYIKSYILYFSWAAPNSMSSLSLILSLLYMLSYLLILVLRWIWSEETSQKS